MSNNYLRNYSRRGKTTRITISVEAKIEEKIDILSAQMSKYTGEEWSMSKVVNLLLLGGILAPQGLGVNEWSMIKQFAEGKRFDIEVSKVEEYVLNLAASRQTV